MNQGFASSPSRQADHRFGGDRLPGLANSRDLRARTPLPSVQGSATPLSVANPDRAGRCRAGDSCLGEAIARLGSPSGRDLVQPGAPSGRIRTICRMRTHVRARRSTNPEASSRSRRTCNLVVGVVANPVTFGQHAAAKRDLAQGTMSNPDLDKQLLGDGVEPWLVDAVQRIARNEDRSLEPWLVTVGEATSLVGTPATCRCRFVRIDPQGRARVPQLVSMLTEHIVDYCIPRSRINQAIADAAQTGSSTKMLRLQREARDLFTKIETSGEGGELLLYALLEIELGIPQVLCKMPLKTSSNVHYHGVDGVHAQALANGKLAVYWGEAKLYADVNAGIDAALESLAPYLLDPGDGATQRDVFLLREHADTGDKALTEALVRFFTEDTVEGSQLVVRGACLVGFSRDNYEHPLEADESVKAEVTAAIASWHDRMATAISNANVSGFELEVFFVPLPSVQDFRDQLIQRLRLE